MVIPVSIYVVMPIIGISAFWLLIRRMRREGVVAPPEVAFFILFFTVGGWLQVLLTAWFWEWSGLASIGMVYLVFIAPVLTAVMFWRLRSSRALSVFHRCAFFVSGAYTCIIAVGLPLAIATHLMGM